MQAQKPINDIEGLKTLGREEGLCPYYYSHLTKGLQDVLVVPYGYLLDRRGRNKLLGYLGTDLNAQIAQ